jgi:membrane-bound inhibitor of C-type lysozyme
MAFDIKRVALSFVLLGAATAPTPAQTLQSNLTLSLGGDAEQHTVQYDCGETFGQISIAYINAAPNFLALVPYEGSTLIFAAVMAASGARYASGNYEWWTKGAEATFTDLTAAKDAPPLATCSELTNTP